MNMQAYGVNELSAEEMQGISGGGERTVWYYIFQFLGSLDCGTDGSVFFVGPSA